MDKSESENVLEEMKRFGEQAKAFQDETYDKIQKQLDILAERTNESPSSDQVKDLEAKLDERSEELKEVNKGLSDLTEQLRLLQTTGLQVDKGSEVDVFKGAFISDPVALKAILDGMAQGEIRAIDSGLFSGGGKLVDEQADAFIDMIVRQSATLDAITTRRMNGPTGTIDELRYTPRKLTLAVEGTAVVVADGLTIKQRPLVNVENALAEDITRTFLEDNIARAGGETQIANILTKQYASDLNDLGMNGDSTTGTFLVINTGFCALAIGDADVTDRDLSGVSGATQCRDALALVSADMPSRFKPISDLTYFVNANFAEIYANEFADRETAAGDEVFVNGFPALRYFGRRLLPEPFMNESQAGVLSDRTILFTPASNLVHSIQRQFTVDSMWQPRPRVIEYTLTMRNDYQHATGEPYVRGFDLPAALRGT